MNLPAMISHLRYFRGHSVLWNYSTSFQLCKKRTFSSKIKDDVEGIPCDHKILNFVMESRRLDQLIKKSTQMSLGLVEFML